MRFGTSFLILVAILILGSATAASEAGAENTITVDPSPTQDDLAAYATILGVLEEPGFCEQSLPAGFESYRFLWLRTFHEPVLIGLTIETTGQMTALFKMTDGQGGYDFGSLSETFARDVNADLYDVLEDTELVDELIDKIRTDTEDEFWSLPFRVDDGTIGVDGATWTIEGVRDGGCHVVTRWSPDRGTPFRTFAETLMRLSGKRFYYDEVY